MTNTSQNLCLKWFVSARGGGRSQIWAKSLGFSPPQRSSYRLFWGWFGLAPWPTPVTHSIGFLCRIRNGRHRLDFSLAFFSHNITLPTFSFFHRIICLGCLIIEILSLLSNDETWTQNLRSFLLAIGQLMSAAVTRPHSWKLCHILSI